MPALHQYDYLFAFGTIFCALDAFNIGANDVANSFATSVSSKSLTMKQACFAAAIMEFLGAVTVGARVADTIKNGIISVSIFRGDPGVQLLAFVCALVSSSVWLTVCTRLSWPVSTTYSIVSAVAGVGVAVGGGDAVNWGWNGGKGLATIFAGFGIAPAISAGFGAVVYLLVKYGVLARKNPIPYALFSGPLVFFTVSAVMTMSIVYKGAPSLGLNKLSESTTAAAIVGTAAVVSALSVLFWLPYVYAKVIRKDYTIRFYHFFLGPALWWRPAPEDAGLDTAPTHVPDYRIRKDEDGNEFKVPVVSDDGESGSEKTHGTPAATANHPSNLKELEKVDEHPIEGAWAEPKNLYIIFRYKAYPWIKKVLTHGTSIDIHAEQIGKEGTAHHRRMEEMHAAAKQYPNEVEHMYSFVQVLTACTASFAHGANDVSNAIGPYAAIYHIWSTGEFSTSKNPVPVWILVFGAVMIVIGLATYGYNIMKVLGNNLTLHSPSRGFSMELGAAITVILASNYGLPVSTTMCITGATMGVALCNGDFRAVNYRTLLWIFSGWVITVPVVGTIAGCLMGIILNAPHFTS
ncbi:sodium:inorganic phosphate symporter [Leucosporidium creatinivorum]|uniref:Phosphate transporter n=1 Tax=Leucosporidium creatinivorum TaxID=106004 RepID=A0A1Y2G1R1_9BASI|nr:sodium:inorganic phosphate symporter [Leucosporidium creatinivorum]